MTKDSNIIGAYPKKSGVSQKADSAELPAISTQDAQPTAMERAEPPGAAEASAAKAAAEVGKADNAEATPLEPPAEAAGAAKPALRSRGKAAEAKAAAGAGKADSAEAAPLEPPAESAGAAKPASQRSRSKAAAGGRSRSAAQASSSRRRQAETAAAATPAAESPSAAETPPATPVASSEAAGLEDEKSRAAEEHAANDREKADKGKATNDAPQRTNETDSGDSSLIELLEQPLKKNKRRETHDKVKVRLRKDLLAKLDTLSEDQPKGFKTRLLNYGLERALAEFERLKSES